MHPLLWCFRLRALWVCFFCHFIQNYTVAYDERLQTKQNSVHSQSLTNIPASNLKNSTTEWNYIAQLFLCPLCCLCISFYWVAYLTKSNFVQMKIKKNSKKLNVNFVTDYTKYMKYIRQQDSTLHKKKKSKINIFLQRLRCDKHRHTDF